MKYPVFILFSALLAWPLASQAQAASSDAPDSSVIPDDPDSLFQPGTPETGQSAPEPAVTPAGASSRLLQAKGVEVGGTLFSDYTAFLTWADSYPDLSHPTEGVSNQFVPNLEADLFFDARPFETLRIFTKLKALYPFSSETSVPGTRAAPLSPLSTGQGTAVPNISVFEVYADLAYKDRLYLRAGQQVVNWGVGYFFSPADLFSVTPIDPMRPALEREGPLALRINAPFADVDNFYLYVVADQDLAADGTFHLDDLGIAPKVEFLLGSAEVGLGAFYQKSRRPKAMATVTGSVFGTIGFFGEGVLSCGKDRILADAVPGAPGVFLTSRDRTTPTFSGTIGARYLQPDWHVSITAQYYYNGQGYADAAQEQAAIAAYILQLQGMPPIGPQLAAADVLQTGMHYIAGLVSWNDILGSKVDLSLFYEGNLSDGSGVASPSIAFTPFRHFTLAFAPYFSYGPDNTELVSLFGRLSLSLKLTLGESPF